MPRAKKRKAVEPPKRTPPSSRPRTRSSGRLAETRQPKSKGVPDPNPSSEDGIDLLGSSPRETHASPRASYDSLDLLLTSEDNTKEKTERVTPVISTPGPSVRKENPRNSGGVWEVVITTPKSFSRTLYSVGGFVTGSPSPSRPVHNGTATSAPLRREALEGPSSPVSQESDTSPSRPLSLDNPYSSPNMQNPAKVLPPSLPSRLEPYLHYQKHAILRALQRPPLFFDGDDSMPSSAFNQLCELWNGTTTRNEGNSCILLGPKGSGKNRLVDRVLASPPPCVPSPVVIRLSAHCQTNDRLAMREIARQVQRQLGSDCSLPSLPNGEEEQQAATELEEGRTDADLPPSSHLPMFVSALPTLGCPVIVVLDAFDGFAAHARQALLYCLLDTVQSCRGGASIPQASIDVSMDQANDLALSENEQTNGHHEPEGVTQDTVKGEHGLLVIGITSQIDCLTLLEKRVKSRFSHRMIRVRTLEGLEEFLSFSKGILNVDLEFSDQANEEWKQLWTTNIENFLADRIVQKAFKETFAFSKDLRVLCRLLTSPILALAPSSPWLSATHLLTSVAIQRCPKHFPFFDSLPYPHIALLIAAAHTRATGHDIFSFEMLYDAFTAQVRTSAAAPVQIAGGAIGMVKVSRGIMVGAFEHLIATRVFQPVAAPVAHITREFVKYQCVAERDEIKAAVEQLGQTNLKRWFAKAQ